jgi:hemolysin III
MSALTDSFSLADSQSSAFAAPKATVAVARVSTTDSIANLRADDLFLFLEDELPAQLPGLATLASVAQALKPRPAIRTAAEELEEEQINTLTHGLGFAISAVGVAYLLSAAVASGGALRIVSCSIYGVALLLMYAASTSLHFAQNAILKRRFQLCDHISIYLLIAGTYTPFLASLLQGAVGFSLLACVWGLAAVGIVNKVRYIGRLEETSCLPCVGLGWLVLIAIRPLLEVMPLAGLGLLVAGGISYSIGVIFFCRDDLPYFHAIWHLFVMAGTALHFCAILNYVCLPN